MAKVKTFVGHTVFAPREWAEATGAASHVRQIDVLAMAYSKADVVGLFEDRLPPRSAAASYAAEMKMARGLLGNTWQAAIDSGAVDPDKPGVYVTRGYGSVNDTIVRVDPDGTYVTVATFQYPTERRSGRLVCVPTHVRPTSAGDPKEKE